MRAVCDVARSAARVRSEDAQRGDLLSSTGQKKTADNLGETVGGTRTERGGHGSFRRGWNAK